MYYSNANNCNCGFEGAEKGWEEEMECGMNEGKGFSNFEGFEGMGGAQQNFGGFQGQGSQMGNGASAGSGAGVGAGCNIGGGKSYNNYYKVNGKNANVVTKDYYNNYYTRYNHIYVKNYKVVKDYVYDYNVVHYSTDTVYNGCQYLGSSCHAENEGNNSGNCGCRPCC
ncbi:MAG: hypothetical protein ACRC7N_12305 [Clostridium sp.]